MPSTPDPIRVYLAGPWAERELIGHIGDSFEAAGLAITEKWWLHQGSDENLMEEALLDVKGVAEAEVFVLINSQKRGQETSGKAVEFGMALALQIPCIVVGEPTNIFHHLVPCVDSPDAAVEMILAAVEGEDE